MTKKERLILIISILASMVAFLDGSIINVALPAMQRSLGGGLILQQWVVDAYAITLGALMLIAGSLSDLFGRKRILTWGLIGFLIASLVCAVAPSAAVLIGARAFQGVAGALLVPSSLAIIMSGFSGAAQGKAIGRWTAWTGIAFVIGPLLGGFLVDTGSWRLIFAINILPIALTLFLLSRLDLVEEKHGSVRVDSLGALLCSLGLGGPVFALIEQPHFGWHSGVVLLPLIGGILLFASFLWYEARAEKPMLPFSLFHDHHNFSNGNIATFAIYGALSAVTLLMTLFLQQVSGYSALDAGMSTLPITILLFLFSSRFGELSGRYGPKWFMTIGPLIMSVGCLLMLRMQGHVTYLTTLFPAVVLFGFGLSVTVAPLTSAILGDIPSQQSGIASAINNAVSRVAGLLGVALFGGLLASRFGADITHAVQLHQLHVAQTTLQSIRNHPMSMQLPQGIGTNSQLGQGVLKASVSAFHVAVIAAASFLAFGGVISAFGIRNTKKAAPVTREK